MKKLFLIAMTLILGVSVMAQQKIQLRSADKAECVKSDMTSLKASFSFSTIDAQDYESERGTFSWLTLANTVLGGNEGDPQIPVVNELIAVPFGANPYVEIKSYSTTDYRLEDYGMKTLVPRQLPMRKDQKPEDVPFIMNEAAYQTRGLRSEPMASIDVVGTMRGVRLGKLGIEPVSYDPVNNTIRVFNDIEVEVHFDGADAHATKQMLVDTYSPYFDLVYKSLFNGRAVTDAYSDHPDLYSTPVKMLVVTTSTFTSSTEFQNWLTWKKQKGIEVDVQTVTSSTSAANVRSLIQSRYNANHPTFLVIVGDETVVKNYTTWSQSSLNYSPYISDNAYASIDSDVYHDMYMSRMAVANTTQLGYLVNKILMYEQYTMPDPSYLNETLLIAGWDSSWTAIAGKPTINYAANNYFNTAHGITPHTFITTASGQTTCYNYINNVGFINYTAHGDIQEWYDPNFTNSNVNSLTNTNKPFWAMGNCCLTANWGNSSYSPCYGEAMICANNKGAFGYIGSIPESYWFEDLYFGVGAFAAQQSSNNNPTVSGTTVGCYDALFDETGFNCLNAVPYIGNVAVTYAHAKNYNSSVSDEYYWRGYQCLGDGSVMPYIKVPAANNVSLTNNGQIPTGASSYTVNADGGSYVAITVNNEIIGVAAVPANATSVAVPFTTTPQAGQTAMIVVTRNQRQPYINNNVPIVGGTEYTISANVSPANSGTVTGAGTYYEDTDCTLTATPNHGYAFDNWKQGNTVVSAEPTYTFTVTGNATYTANFHALTQHHLTYNPNQTNGTISVSPTDAYAGDIITLTATPAAGYCLDQWHVTTGRAEIPVVNNQFTMPDSDVTITATFKSGYTVTVASVANGTITASSTSAMPGDIITLTATPNTGCEFMTWYVYKTGDPSTVVTVFQNTIRMPSYDVTVSASFATSATADPTTVGSGTSTNNYIPTYAYYNYSLTQQIYTTAEVGDAATITAIAFKATSNAATRNLDIYMRPTDLTAFSSTTGWETMGPVYKVFSGSVAFNTSGWTTITLDTPYKYDGTKNINICVVDNTGSYSNNYPAFYVYSTGANRAMRVYNDDNAYSVNTSDAISEYTGTYVTSNNQIQFTKKLINAETLTVTPTSLADFSYVQGNGPSETKSVDVTGVDLSSNITVTAPTGFEVSTSATGTYTQTITIPRATSKGNRATQTWGFEGSFENWTTVDSDGDGYNWVLGSACGGVYLAAGSNLSEGHTGSDLLVSGSFSNVSGVGALTPDNWLISPQVTLGGTFSMWAKGQDDSWFAEHFGIYVSTTDANPSSFIPLEEWTIESAGWKQYSVDLSFFAGVSGYIAVRHFDCTNMFFIDVDDFELNTDATYTPDLPVTITPATVYVRLADGLDPDEYTGNMTFVAGTKSATVSLSGEVIPSSGNQYTITVEASPAAGGTVAGGGTYYEGSHRNITATPAAHYTFTGWQLNGSIVSTDNPYSITVTGDATYTAVFTEMPQYTVTVTQATGGTIAANPTTAYPGDVVTLSVTPESGYFLEAWNVTDANSQPISVTNDQFTMPESNVTVTATFTQGFTLTLNQTENGTISADQTQNLQPGDVVNLTATPDNDCVLLTWYAHKTGDTRTLVSVVDNSFIIMPAYDVTIMGVFVTTEQYEATIGSGTSRSNYIPTYVRANYSMTQQIYTKTELGGQKGTITQIQYYGYGSNNTSAATRSLIIYMQNTSKSSFTSNTDWESMGNPQKVFTGSVTFNRNAWATITLDTPFEYDGEANINICVLDNTGSTSGSNTRYISFYSYSTNENRAIYANGSSTYTNILGYSSLSSTTGTRLTSNSRINITMTRPGSAESLTVSPGEIDDFSYVEGYGPSTTNKIDVAGIDLSNDITLTAPQDFEISLTENGPYSNSLTIARETGSKGSRAAQTWDFDDSSFQGWTTVDANNDGYDWVLGSAVDGVYYSGGNFAGGGHNNSADLLVSGSYSSVSGVGAITPDNWLISPQVSLAGSFSMWAGSIASSDYAEHFGIYVSYTDANPSSFILLNEWTLTSSAWKQYSVDLSAFNGANGYIAIRHFNCSDMWTLEVDDFVLDPDAGITIEYPVTITSASVYVRMAAGLEQGSYSGTLNAAAGNDFTGSVSLAGEVIFPSFVKKILGFGDVTNPGGYYLIASPIGQVAPTNVTNMLEETYDLYYFDQDTDGNGNEWINYRGDANVSHADFSLEPGIGYLYANSNTVDLTFTGRPIAQSSYTVTLEKHDDARFAGWNLVGNPFAQTAWVDTDHNAYYTMNGAGTAFIGVTSNSVEAMEGIFVRANSDEEEISFTTIDPNAKCSSLALNLSQGNGLMDRATVRFDEGCQLPKLQFNRNSSKVYIPMDSEDYAVVRGEEIGEMPINFKAESNGTYNLCLSTDNVEFAYLHLVDNLTGNDVDLLQTPSYTFDARTTDYESRFRLVFATGNNSNDDNFAFFSNGSFVINNEGKATLQVIDVTGRVLKSETINGCANVSVNGAAGVYMLRLINGDNMKVQKVVVK